MLPPLNFFVNAVLITDLNFATISKDFLTLFIPQFLRSVLLTKYHSADQVKKTKMSEACSTDRGQEKCEQSFSGET